MDNVKWIKITTNIFNDDKIQLIESMPDSDTIIVVWFKLLALAGTNNLGGIVMFNEKTPYTEDMLVVLFRRKKTVIKLALDTFVAFSMIDILDDNTILIKNWERHQNIDGLEAIREKGRIRVQKHREKQKTLLLDTKDKEKDEELEKDIDIESSVTVTLQFIKDVISFLNEKTNKNFSYKIKPTQTKIKARINDNRSLEDFKKVILIKTAEWINTEMDQYLRPETLFGNKFESYLNQKEINRQGKGKNIIPEDIKSDWLTDYIDSL